jgi:ATP-dependent DNA helicase 2 subunit 2
MAQAVEELEVPRVKYTRPFKSYEGPLNLGDPKNYDSAISIIVERYTMTKVATAPTASNVTIKSEPGGSTQTTQTLEDMDGVERTGPEFAGVSYHREYKVEDPNAPGGKVDVDMQDLAKGYQYGRTAVFISESDQSITKLETIKDFSIVGFIPQEKVDPIPCDLKREVLTGRK